jgi:hypothetical protein
VAFVPGELAGMSVPENATYGDSLRRGEHVGAETMSPHTTGGYSWDQAAG